MIFVHPIFPCLRVMLLKAASLMKILILLSALCAAAWTALAQPTISIQPRSFSVSLNAAITNVVTASGAGTLSYQWRRDENDLLGETNRTLVIVAIQAIHAGAYQVRVNDTAGETLSQSKLLDVDEAFAKVTASPVVTTPGHFYGGSWCDFDNDGDPDLFVSRDVSESNLLFRNLGNGAFATATIAEIGTLAGTTGNFQGGSWADFDNDGNADLFVANLQRPSPYYRNNGNGSLSLVNPTNLGAFAINAAITYAGAWADFDNDGFIDLYVANASEGSSPNSFLYRNSGLGTFLRVTNAVSTNATLANAAAWGDYDNDGDADLFVATYGNTRNQLLRNDGGGRFTRIASGNIVTDFATSFGCAWGDYDNNGYLDLFVSNFENQRNLLYRNNGDGTFTKILTGDIVNEVGNFYGCAWGDYDNDGFLDLFVSNGGSSAPNNRLYRNNGDGTFTKITRGSLVNDGGISTGCEWADYDRDGFLDLFVANGGQLALGRNFLYRNSGNSNRWINVRCVGDASNRSAIGAKVRLRATIGGLTRWQLREISGGSGATSQPALEAAFGLGNATSIELIRIEWPSGVTQELRDVPVNQFLTVREPTVISPPVVTTGATVQLSIRARIGGVYQVEGTTNLTDWLPLATVTNLTGVLEFPDPVLTEAASRFYRIRTP